MTPSIISHPRRFVKAPNSGQVSHGVAYSLNLDFTNSRNVHHPEVVVHVVNYHEVLGLGIERKPYALDPLGHPKPGRHFPESPVGPLDKGYPEDFPCCPSGLDLFQSLVYRDRLHFGFPSLLGVFLLIDQLYTYFGGL